MQESTAADGSSQSMVTVTDEWSHLISSEASEMSKIVQSTTEQVHHSTSHLQSPGDEEELLSTSKDLLIGSSTLSQTSGSSSTTDPLSSASVSVSRTTHLPLDPTTRDVPFISTSSHWKTPEQPLDSTESWMTTAVALGSSGGLSGGAVAGLVIAVLLIVAILVVTLMLLLRRSKKQPILRVHYKNKESYYYQDNHSICRNSTSSFGVSDNGISLEMQNPACYDAYLNGTQDSSGVTLKYNGENGLSRPPSLSAHEDALMFTLSQTNNNATLLRKSSNSRNSDQAMTNGGHSVSVVDPKTDLKRESIGQILNEPSLFEGSDLLDEIMDTVGSRRDLNSESGSILKSGGSSSCDKHSIISIESDLPEKDPPSDQMSTPPKESPKEGSTTLERSVSLNGRLSSVFYENPGSVALDDGSDSMETQSTC